MPNKMDQLLEIGSTPDWISPLVAMIKDLTNGPYCRFYIDRHCGLSVSAIVRLLNSYGVNVWGDTIQDDMIIFTVKQAQSEWTQYLLRREGIAYMRYDQ